MAYHPNVPAPINRVQDDIAAMRDNFQHLAPLAQAVGELQTVSGLAPVVDELQAVSALAPYVQALLDGRIVEMGSNSNGTYVRWENGLQICWAIRTITDITSSTHTIQGLTFYRSGESTRWYFPATFVGAPAAMAMGVRLHKNGVLVNDRTSSPTMFSPHATKTWMEFQFVSLSEFDEARDVPTIAIGRWK